MDKRATLNHDGSDDWEGGDREGGENSETIKRRSSVRCKKTTG